MLNVIGNSGLLRATVRDEGTASWSSLTQNRVLERVAVMNKLSSWPSGFPPHPLRSVSIASRSFTRITSRPLPNRPLALYKTTLVGLRTHAPNATNATLTLDSGVRRVIIAIACVRCRCPSCKESAIQQTLLRVSDRSRANKFGRWPAGADC